MMETVVKQRILRALRGAFVADAASMGTHWIYDPTKMAETVGTANNPEFMNPPTPQFYSSKEFPGHYQDGMLSPYGEQLLFVTDHVASTSNLEGDTMSQAMLQWAQEFGGRPDSAMNAFVANMKDGKRYPECGADDNQAHIFMKIIPVTCRYAGSQQLLEKVKTAIQVHQNNEMAIAFGIAAARILEAVLLGANVPDALETVRTNLKQDGLGTFQTQVEEAFETAKKVAASGQSLSDYFLELSHEMMKDKPDSPFYDLIGRSCQLPGSFIGPLVLLYRNTPFIDSIRTNILAAGDTCSRAIFLGAVLGAANEKVPWMDHLDVTVRAKAHMDANQIAEKRVMKQ